MVPLLLASALCSLVTSITPPNTSLATIPVAYFGGTTKPRPPANLEMLSKMRLVMVEKWEGHCWADCLANATAVPARPCRTSCDVERDMLATLRAVKAINPQVSTVFYWNTVLAFPFYAQVGEFASNSALLVDANTHAPLELRNDNGMPGIGVYDFGKAEGRQLWQGMVETLVHTGLVDGIFGDKWSVYATNNATNTTAPDPGGWKICNHWCGGLNEEEALAFNAGKNATLRAVEAFLGPKAVYFSATDDLIKHNKNPAELIAAVNRQLATAPYAYVYGTRDQQPDHDPANYTSECDERFVAMFLLAVEEGAFLGCNGWSEDFAKPLGAPLGKALSSGGTMRRKFSSGTSVVWDLEANTGVIHWADAATAATAATPTATAPTLKPLAAPLSRGCTAGKCPVDAKKLGRDVVAKGTPFNRTTVFGSVLNIGKAAGAAFSIALNSYSLNRETNTPLALPPLRGVEAALGVEASVLIPVEGGYYYVVNFDSQGNHTDGTTAVYKVTHDSACGVEPNFQVSPPKLLDSSSCLEVFEDPRPTIGPVDHILCVVRGNEPDGTQHMQIRSIDFADGAETVLTAPFAVGLDPYLGMAVADLSKGLVHVFAVTGPHAQFELSVWTVDLLADDGAPNRPVTSFVIADEFPMLHCVHYSPHSRRIYTSYTSREAGVDVNRIGYAAFEPPTGVPSALVITPLGPALDKKYTQLNPIVTTTLLRDYGLPAELFLSTMFDGSVKPPVLYLVGVNNVTGTVSVSTPVTNPFIDIEAPAVCHIHS